jgi:hypothetical protein
MNFIWENNTMEEKNKLNVSENVTKFNEGINESKKSAQNQLKLLKVEHEKLLDAFESKKKVVSELETTIAKSNIDFLMNLLDIYKGISEVKQEVKINEELLNRDSSGEISNESPFNAIMSKIDTVLIYLFPSEEKYNETRELFKQNFGRASVHTEPTEKEIEEFKRVNSETETKKPNKKYDTKVVKFKR